MRKGILRHGLYKKLDGRASRCYHNYRDKPGRPVIGRNVASAIGVCIAEDGVDPAAGVGVGLLETGFPLETAVNHPSATSVCT